MTIPRLMLLVTLFLLSTFAHAWAVVTNLTTGPTASSSQPAPNAVAVMLSQGMQEQRHVTPPPPKKLEAGGLAAPCVSLILKKAQVSRKFGFFAKKFGATP